MRKQRHNWIYYLVIISMIILPFQYGQAMGVDHSQHHSFKCQKSSMHSQKHDGMSHVKLADSGDKQVCSDQHNCTQQHHCVKCEKDKKVNDSFVIKRDTVQKLLFISANFYEFYPHTELRPPQA